MMFAHSECSYAKIHSIETIPMFMAGKASGRIKTGVHVAGNGEPVTRVSLTVQQLMGVPINSYGAGAMATSKNIAEVVA
jgi:hypothetical protein